MKMVIKKIYRMIIPKILRNYISVLRSKERKIRKGYEHRDKTFYVIRANYNCGLMATLDSILMHIRYAVERNFIPIVDMQNYPNCHLPETMLGKENAWEYYFEQPCNFSLKDIMEAKNIVLGKMGYRPFKNTDMQNWQSNLFDKDKKHFLEYKEYFEKYVRINKTTLQILNKRKNDLFGDKGKILAVKCRGTDYTIQKPKDHRILPTPNELATKVREVMQNFNFDFIFLATEEQDALELFKTQFGEKLLYLDEQRVSLKEVELNGGWLRNVEFSNNLEYLTSVYLLSKCNGFIGGVVGGTFGAYLLRDKPYEYEYLYDLGLY